MSWTNSKSNDRDQCTETMKTMIPPNLVCLGAGTYGKVYGQSPRRVAKTFGKTNTILAQTLVRQMAVMTWVGSHPNLLTLCRKQNFLDPANPQIVFARMSGPLQIGDLTAHRTWAFSRQLVSGLAYLHRRGVVHRDIKPSNILVNAPATQVKLADWDLATTIWGRPDRTLATTPEVVSLGYRPPELLMGYVYASSVDLFRIDAWSLGVVIYAMATGSNPLLDNTDIGSLFRIFQLLGSPSRSDPFFSALPLYNPQLPFYQPRVLFAGQDGRHMPLPQVQLCVQSLLQLDPRARVSVTYLDEQLNGLVVDPLVQAGECCPAVADAELHAARAALDATIGWCPTVQSVSEGTRHHAACYMAVVMRNGKMARFGPLMLAAVCLTVSAQMHEYLDPVDDMISELQLQLVEFREAHTLILASLHYRLVIPSCNETVGWA